MGRYVEPAWGRQPDEGSALFAAFQGYLRMPPPRNATQLARQNGKSEKTFQNYCARNRWVERAALWDAHQAECQAERILKTTIRGVDDHVRVLEGALQLGWSKIEEMLQKGEKPATAREAMALISEAIRLIKELRLAAQNTASLADVRKAETEMSFKDFTEKELDDFTRLLNKGQGRVTSFPDDPAEAN